MIVSSGFVPMFCPATRPERFEKALAVADCLIIDLEDAVAPDEKDAARELAMEALASLDVDRVVLRVNPLASDYGHADVEMARDMKISTVMLPKVEEPAQIESVRPMQVIALCETVRGVLGASALAATANCSGLMWGGEDLIASLGGFKSRDSDGAYLPVVTHARVAVLMGAASVGKFAFDGVYLMLNDSEGLLRESREAAAMGFWGKVAIHPRQVSVIRQGFTPEPEDLERAKEVLHATERGLSGVLDVGGRMVDGPLIAQASRVVAAWEAARRRRNEQPNGTDASLEIPRER